PAHRLLLRPHHARAARQAAGRGAVARAGRRTGAGGGTGPGSGGRAATAPTRRPCPDARRRGRTGTAVPGAPRRHGVSMAGMASPVSLVDALAAREAYLATLRGLVELESPTHDKRAVDALAGRLERLLTERGWSVQRHERAEVGDVLEARRRGGSGPSTLLLTHMDTVWPVGTLEVMPTRDDGERFWGPGTLDMKAGIAAAVHAVDLLAAKGAEPAGDVTLLVTSDEETGSHHSRELIEGLARRHDRVLVLEPARDDGALKVGRKGVGGYTVTFKGRSAHAGNDPA